MNWLRQAIVPLRPVYRILARISHYLIKALAVVSLVWITVAARSTAQTPQPFPPSDVAGRMIVLPGIHNTLFHLDGFIEMARASLPNVQIDRRKWGITLLGIYNLRAEEKNRSTARELAADIAAWRRKHPEKLLYLMGYSGGGGVASLVMEELPDDIQIDRLILIAPAISVDYPIDHYASEHVSDFVINFASTRDRQVGLGTRLFGTIDRKYEYAAGFDGFSARSEKLAQWHWREADRSVGHRGNHVAYLGRRWQHDFLLPAIDPSLSREALEQLWRVRRGEIEFD